MPPDCFTVLSLFIGIAVVLTTDVKKFCKQIREMFGDSSMEALLPSSLLLLSALLTSCVCVCVCRE